jgi:hypothetical protein
MCDYYFNSFVRRTLLIRLKGLGHQIDFNYSDKNGQIQA